MYIVTVGHNPCIYMDYRGGDHLNGRLWLCAAVRCVCGLSLLSSRLNSGPVCDDYATEGSMHKCKLV